MIFRAQQDVPADTELKFGYINGLEDYEERQVHKLACLRIIYVPIVALTTLLEIAKTIRLHLPLLTMRMPAQDISQKHKTPRKIRGRYHRVFRKASRYRHGRLSHPPHKN